MELPHCGDDHWPKSVMLELTNACDIKCRHCPYHGDGVEKLRPIGEMSEPMWRSALEEIASWNTDIVLQPWGMGEPLLHPQLWDFVREAKRHPRIQVGFYSNGNQWTAADIRAAIESDLDWVCLSIDGIDREVFEHYRVGADLDRVIATAHGIASERAKAGRERPQLRINMVEYPELRGKIEESVAAFRRIADSVMVSRFREVGNRRFSPVDMPRIPCYQLDSMLLVAHDGRVVQCCEDQQGESLLGWFPAMSLTEIWQGSTLRKLRRAHLEGRYDASPLCADCDGWAGKYELEEQRGDTRVRRRAAGTVFEFDRVHAEQER